MHMKYMYDAVHLCMIINMNCYYPHLYKAWDVYVYICMLHMYVHGTSFSLGQIWPTQVLSRMVPEEG